MPTIPLDKVGNTKERTDWGGVRIILFRPDDFKIPVGHPEEVSR